MLLRQQKQFSLLINQNEKKIEFIAFSPSFIFFYIKNLLYKSMSRYKPFNLLFFYKWRDKNKIMFLWGAGDDRKYFWGIGFFKLAFLSRKCINIVIIISLVVENKNLIIQIERVEMKDDLWKLIDGNLLKGFERKKMIMVIGNGKHNTNNTTKCVLTTILNQWCEPSRPDIFQFIYKEIWCFFLQNIKFYFI